MNFGIRSFAGKVNQINNQKKFIGAVTLFVLLILVFNSAVYAQSAVNSKSTMPLTEQEQDIHLVSDTSTTARHLLDSDVLDLPKDIPVIVNEEIILDGHPRSYQRGEGVAATSSFIRGEKMNETFWRDMTNRTYCSVYIVGSMSIRDHYRKVTEHTEGVNIRLKKNSILHLVKSIKARNGIHMFFDVVSDQGETGFLPYDRADENQRVYRIGIRCNLGFSTEGSIFYPKGSLKLKSVLYHLGGRLVLPW
jgi:hypothetical protein